MSLLKLAKPVPLPTPSSSLQQQQQQQQQQQPSQQQQTEAAKFVDCTSFIPVAATVIEHSE
jgi:hypothetical protein